MDMKSPPGYVSSGFSVKRKIGSGSFSTVYLALDKSRGIDVAIKCIDKSKISRDGADRIIREIKILKLIKHHHIVEMLDFHWDDRYVYIVFEYCDGGDLSKYIKARKKIPEAYCKKFMKQLIAGLEHLRFSGVYHYDLKPHNILVKTQPQILLKISDFGLSLFADTFATERSRLGPRGTLSYMAPEMLMCSNYNPSLIDLWSLGVILYECLHGKLPFPQKNAKELMTAMKMNKPIIVDKSISSCCKNLLNRLLCYDPQERITFGELLNDPFIKFDDRELPSEQTYRKAVETTRAAVKCDHDGNLRRAFYKYCESLKYMLPFLTVETNEKRRALIFNKIYECARRAEEFTAIFYKAKIHYNMVVKSYWEKEVVSDESIEKSSENLTEDNTDANTEEFALKLMFVLKNQSLNLLEKNEELRGMIGKRLRKGLLLSRSREESLVCDALCGSDKKDDGSRTESSSTDSSNAESSSSSESPENVKCNKMVRADQSSVTIMNSSETTVLSTNTSITEEGAQPHVCGEFEERVDEEDESRFPTHLTTDQVALLKQMARPTGKMYDGLEFGYAGQMYLSERNYIEASKKLMLALSVLVPILQKEPCGRRRELLVIQVKEFLDQAECVKILLSTNSDLRRLAYSRYKTAGFPPDVLNVEDFCKIQ